MGLTCRPHRTKLGPRDRLEVISDGYCPENHDRPVTGPDGEITGWEERQVPATLAHAGFEIVAKTLAEPLRHAFWSHAREHDCWAQWPACREYQRLAAMLPDGDIPAAMA